MDKDKCQQPVAAIYSHEFFLAAGECNAEKSMSLAMLVNRIIRVATEHANMLDVGYASLTPMGKGWVLSKLTLEMKRYPHVNEIYKITTWIEGVDRFLCSRNFVIYDGDGCELGYVRSLLVVIDFHTRMMCDMSLLGERMLMPVGDMPSCPIAKPSRIKLTGISRTSICKFRYCDVDFNRHVNTVRYIEAFLNCWPLEHHDRYMVNRFEISFVKECLYGMEVNVKIDETDEFDCKAEIESNGVTYCRARFLFKESEFHGEDY